MLPDRRAVVCDLDDTLYPYRWYARSGFAAIAVHLERTRQLDARTVFQCLLRASRGADRGRELQVCLKTFRLSGGMLPVLIGFMRGHQPRLHLPRPSARVLAVLRREGWRLGILTNGPPPAQARKIAALGLARCVDTVVYAAQYNGGKPHPAPFAEIARRLETPVNQIVLLGDDEACDMAGALGAGMLAVRCDAWTGKRPEVSTHLAIDHVSDLPHAARLLLEEAFSRHAA